MRQFASLLLFAAMLVIAGCSGSNSFVQQPEAQTPQIYTTETPVVTATSSHEFVAPNKSVQIAFNQAMDPATINSANISMPGAPANVMYDSRNAIAYIQPLQPLGFGQTYNVFVSDVRSEKGVLIPKPYTFSLHTREALSSSPPHVTALVGECVIITGKVFVRFSEDMDSTTINEDTFFVEGVTGTVAYDAVTRTASFTPDAPFEPNTAYTAHVTTGVADLSGTHLEEEFIFTFNTCAEDQEQNFCTFTKGGYQGGGTPGQIFDENFPTVFFDDLIIGVFDGAGAQHHHRWTGDATGAAALKQFLTSPAGGVSTALLVDATNPSATTSGDLATQVATLTLNVGFSGVEGMPAGFGDLTLVNTGTSLDGSTVSEILAIANQALAGNGLPVGYSFSDLNELITNLNESWDNCVESEWAQQHLE
jgi:hypothetical protein